ncbi:hypothetical protein UFOVP236_62 [uncultured Caudovirales phage]|uniref:Uncharacterized protein n=1 Tax=uncultured Caudovirales phage TaxID=2100421 RepID=A0A6J7WRC1_9CAUD|nr:hypothetical protein UFOVP236_62 [uncultured Caudovirales phage]
MSLDYNLTTIRSFENVCYTKNEAMNPITECLIFTTMSIGMSRITKENYRQFYARMAAYHGVIGKPLVRYNEDTNVREKFAPTIYDVRDHIGLSTNASRKSDSQFMKQLTTNVQE